MLYTLIQVFCNIGIYVRQSYVQHQLAHFSPILLNKLRYYINCIKCNLNVITSICLYKKNKNKMVNIKDVIKHISNKKYINYQHNVLIQRYCTLTLCEGGRGWCGVENKIRSSRHLGCDETRRGKCVDKNELPGPLPPSNPHTSTPHH